MFFTYLKSEEDKSGQTNPKTNHIFLRLGVKVHLGQFSNSFCAICHLSIQTQFWSLLWQIHIMSIDFALLSTFAPFWVYNDMSARKWLDNFQDYSSRMYSEPCEYDPNMLLSCRDGKGSWLLPLSLIPFVGPALYLLLRPSLSVAPVASVPTSDETWCTKSFSLQCTSWTRVKKN